MNWGYKIFFSYVIFIAIMMYLVVRSFQTNIDLVTEDYYGEEIKFQEKIDKQKNTASLKEAIKAKVADEGILVIYPKELTKLEGEIHLYRPSEATEDQRFAINVDSQFQQVLITTALKKGKYVLKFDWSDGLKDYYQEIPLYLN